MAGANSGFRSLRVCRAGNLKRMAHRFQVAFRHWRLSMPLIHPEQDHEIFHRHPHT